MEVKRSALSPALGSGQGMLALTTVQLCPSAGSEEPGLTRPPSRVFLGHSDALRPHNYRSPRDTPDWRLSSPRRTHVPRGGAGLSARLAQAHSEHSVNAWDINEQQREHGTGVTSLDFQPLPCSLLAVDFG